MIELKKIPFDAETFLANAGLGRRIVQMEAKQVSSFHREIPPTRFSIFRTAGRSSLFFPPAAKKRPLRFSPTATSSERSASL
jgi:hypothetical protein